jgi:hypothetical protein
MFGSKKQKMSLVAVYAVLPLSRDNGLDSLPKNCAMLMPLHRNAQMQSVKLTVLMSKTGHRRKSYVFLILLQNLLTLELSAGRLSQIDGCSPSDGSAVM